jgi:hypothetical protein
VHHHHVHGGGDGVGMPVGDHREAVADHRRRRRPPSPPSARRCIPAPTCTPSSRPSASIRGSPGSCVSCAAAGAGWRTFC